MRIVKVNKKLTDLDELVIKFSEILSKFLDYVIVSGYVSILFGEERPTQDVDVLVSNISKEKAKELYNSLKKGGFVIALDFDAFYRILFEIKEKVDIFTEKQWFFDVKVVKDLFDIYTLKNRIKVVLNDKYEIFISPPEMQIPYKLYLGAEKDIKDAIFLFEKFKEIIDMEEMEKIAKAMGISLEVLEYGVKD